MAEAFNCPNCGAPLDYQGSDPIIRCPYCNGSVVVPDNLRAKPSFSSQPHNFTLSGPGNLSDLVQQARKFKEVKDLALSGKTSEAVALYQQITGSTDQDARLQVDALAHNRPITLTGLNMGELMPSVRVTTPIITPSSQPALQQSPRKTGRSIGCGVGCLITLVVAFILITTILPVAGGFTGIAVGLKPEIVLTALPFIAKIPGVSGNGTTDLSFGGEGTGPGLFQDARAIAVNPTTGEIFAADYEGGRIQKFDSTGKFETQWVVEGKKIYISSMAVNRDGNVFVIGSGKLLQYDKNGNLISQLKAGSMDSFESVALGPDGTIYAVKDEKVVHIKSNGQVLAQLSDVFSSNGGEYEMDPKIAVDGQGKIFVLGTFNDAVFIFDPQGKFISKFGSDGDAPGQFTAPESIAVDGKGNVYVSDFNGIQVFSNDGRYLNTIHSDFAFGLAFDDQGKLYMTTNQDKIERYIILK